MTQYPTAPDWKTAASYKKDFRIASKRAETSALGEYKCNSLHQHQQAKGVCGVCFFRTSLLGKPSITISLSKTIVKFKKMKPFQQQ